MFIVDSALEKRQQAGNPIRVALIGAGYMGRGIALELLTGLSGMRLVAIANRTGAEAERAYHEAGVESVRVVETPEQLEDAIRQGHYAVTDNPRLLCAAETIEAIIEATGEIEFGAQMVLNAIE